MISAMLATGTPGHQALITLASSRLRVLVVRLLRRGANKQRCLGRRERESVARTACQEPDAGPRLSPVRLEGERQLPVGGRDAALLYLGTSSCMDCCKRCAADSAHAGAGRRRRDNGCEKNWREGRCAWQPVGEVSLHLLLSWQRWPRSSCRVPATSPPLAGMHRLPNHWWASPCRRS